jgi:hypothetical protein
VAEKGRSQGKVRVVPGNTPCVDMILPMKTELWTQKMEKHSLGASRGGAHCYNRGYCAPGSASRSVHLGNVGQEVTSVKVLSLHHDSGEQNLFRPTTG